MNDAEMNVYVAVMTDAGPITPTMPEVPAQLDYLPIAIGAIVMGVVFIAAIVIRRRAP